MFCSLKIAVCVLKIPIGRKKIKIPIRLKITGRSKNYDLKIPVRVRVYARMYACMIEENRTHDHDQHTTGTGPPEHTTAGKGRTQAKRKKPVYICMFAGNEKKYKKS